MAATKPLSNADRDRIRAALRFYVEHYVWAKSDAERDEYLRLLSELQDPLQVHGVYSIHQGDDVPCEVHHRSHGAVGGAPSLQDARNLIDEMGGRLRS